MSQETNNLKLVSNGIKYFIGIPFLIGVSIAIFAPTDVLKYGVAQMLNDIAAFIFPAVRKIKGDYELGQVAKLYFSVMWLMSPLIFFGGYRDIQRQADKVVLNIQKNRLFVIFLVGILFPIVGICMANLSMESTDPYDIRTMLTFHTRWGMPLWGFVIPAGASTLIAMGVFVVRNIHRTFD